MKDNNKKECIICKIFLWAFIFSIGAVVGSIATLFIVGGY